MDQYGEFIGVDSLCYAMVTVDTANTYTAGTPTELAPVAEIAGQPKVSKKTAYYNNKPRTTFTTEAETEIKVIVSNVPAQKAATLLGKNYDATSGRVYDSGAANPPDVALGFRFNMGKNGYRYYWYLKGTFSGGSEDAKSKEADVDIKTYELTFTAVTTERQWMIDGESKSMKRVFADTADDAFVATSWFTQVQTPDTSSAPDALALSSIVPADDATGVSASANIVLTFSNKITDNNIFLVNSPTGEVVSVTKSWDSTGKILTLAHSALTSGARHAIIIANVTDVYGQELADAVSYFTVA